MKVDKVTDANKRIRLQERLQRIRSHEADYDVEEDRHARQRALIKEQIDEALEDLALDVGIPQGDLTGLRERIHLDNDEIDGIGEDGLDNEQNGGNDG